MQRWPSLITLFLLGAVSLASAQPLTTSGNTEVSPIVSTSGSTASAGPLEPGELERGVAEQLAARGVVLARLGYTVRIAVEGNGAEVSLVDAVSQRVLRVGSAIGLGPTQEAAVSALVPIAEVLVARELQASSRAAPPPGEASASGAKRQTDEAERRFAREAIGFGDDVAVSVMGGAAPILSVSREWVAWRGELRTRLSPQEFCELVNRQERCRQWRTRRAFGVSMMVGGVAVAAASFGYVFTRDLEDGFSSSTSLVAFGGIGAGALMYFAGVRSFRAQVMSEADAKAAAQQYNDALRRELGLPVAGRPRARSSVQWTGVAPLVGPGQAGLGLAGRF